MDANAHKRIIILIAEDDDADFKLAKRAFDKLQILNEVTRLHNGQELIDYLRGNPQERCVVLLDLNMPIKDGREALREIKADAGLNHIPVIVMTTSKAEEDVVRSYHLGANAYIRKPVKHDEFVNAIAEFKRFWLDIVELPYTS